MESTTVHLEETAARRVLLVRAVEEADPDGRIVGQAERDAIERELARELRPGGGGQVDRGAFLHQRAVRMLAVVAKRQPGLAAWQEPQPWLHWAPWVLPLAACLAGAGLDRIDNPQQQVNMLSPPLLGVLAWNVFAYLLLLLGALGLWRRLGTVSPVQRLMAVVPRSRTSGLRAGTVSRFQSLWLAATAQRQGWWLQHVLHWTAAGWAVGLALSIAIGGLVRQYRVGWESTLLDPGAVHALLTALFWPVVTLLPFDAFSTPDLQRMAFGAQPPAGVGEARRWVWMYLALLAMVVIVPRGLLGLWARWRRRHAAGVAIDVADPYFAAVLARALPGRLTLGIVALDADAQANLHRLFRQLVPGTPPSGPRQPWTVLATTEGDELRVLELEAHDPDGEADVLLVAAPMARLAGLAPRLGATGRAAVLVRPLGEGDSRTAFALAAQAATGGPLPIVDAADLLRACDAPSLLDALQQVLPPARRPAVARMAQAWRQKCRDTSQASLLVLARWLLQAAAESEAAATAPAGLRQLVDPSQRESAQRDRDDAAQALLQRLAPAQQEASAALLRLHGTAPLQPQAVGLVEYGAVHWHQPVDSPQAGLAGAASGAAMGAGIDLMTGGMTLGAAAALGALIGGTAALTAALRKNKAAAPGQSLVQLSDDMLQGLTEHAVLVYLAVARRESPSQAQLAWPAWRSEVVAAVEHRREALVQHWAQARSAGAAPAPDRLAEELGSLVRSVQARL